MVVGIIIEGKLYIYNTELILIGGSVSKIGDLLFKPSMKVVKERAFETGAKTANIKPALLGEDSNLFGAAVLVQITRRAEFHGLCPWVPTVFG